MNKKGGGGEVEIHRRPWVQTSTYMHILCENKNLKPEYSIFVDICLLALINFRVEEV